MQQRLSLRESRRLQRRFLQLDERASRPIIMLAGGSTSTQPAVAPPTAASSRATARGPYEWDYPVSGGYSTERTIIVP